MSYFFRRLTLLATAAALLTGCTALNDFDQFSFDAGGAGSDAASSEDGGVRDAGDAGDGSAGDGSVPPDDGSVPIDGGVSIDGSVPIDGSVDAGVPDAGGMPCPEDQRVQDGACVPCPANSTNDAGDNTAGDNTACDCIPGTGGDGITECRVGLCGMNQRVRDNACVNCPARASSAGGDDPTGADTTCDCDPGTMGDGVSSCTIVRCSANQRVASNACVACPTNSTNASGDDASGADTACDCDPGTTGNGRTSCAPIRCPANQRVASNACVACPTNSTNASGDDASGADTACDCDPGTTGNGRTSCAPIRCPANQRVASNACVACPTNSTNASGDDASGADTACDCNTGFSGNGRTSCSPVCGDSRRVSGEACDDGNQVSETACPYGTMTCTRCNATCTATLSLTGPFCGDGVTQGGEGESCDDGNTATNDCCSPGCGFLCDEREVNNRTTTANPAPTDGTVVTGGIDPGTDVDYWRITVTARAGLAIETVDPFGSNPCNASRDTVIRLLDSAGMEIAANDDKGGTDQCSRLDPVGDTEVRDLSAGTYYVVVESTGAGIARYGLRVTQGAPVYCGNGTAEAFAGEACDDGTNLGATTGSCLACLGTIEQQREIRTGGSTNGQFGAVGVLEPAEYADTLCPTGFRAMFADGRSRIGTLTAYEGDGQLNWTVFKFTAYYNRDGEHVFSTDSSALIGVREGSPMNLRARIGLTNGVWTGMNNDSTTLAASESCRTWTTSSDTQTGQIGNSGQLTSTFLEIGTNDCDFTRRVYCVEQ